MVIHKIEQKTRVGYFMSKFDDIFYSSCTMEDSCTEKLSSWQFN